MLRPQKVIRTHPHLHLQKSSPPPPPHKTPTERLRSKMCGSKIFSYTLLAPLLFPLLVPTFAPNENIVSIGIIPTRLCVGVGLGVGVTLWLGRGCGIEKRGNDVKPLQEKRIASFFFSYKIPIHVPMVTLLMLVMHTGRGGKFQGLKSNYSNLSTF